MRKTILRDLVVMVFFMTTQACTGFEVPSAYERSLALGPLDDCPSPLRQFLQPDGDFPPIHQPRRGDWLAVHAERGETYGEYLTSGFNRPNARRRFLYIMPLGDFPEDKSPSLESLRAYAEAFFQLDARLLPAVSFDAEQHAPRINPQTNKRQLLTGSILKQLKTQLPADAYCLIAVTMEDLYPARSWNYVFGQASLSERVGIYSFARYDPRFFGEKCDQDVNRTILQRSCKVLAHETGHMFGLRHCIHFECLMNGSNSLEETDLSPQHLCPVCLRKLHFNVQFDPLTRYVELERFHEAQGWEDDASWIRRQLNKAEPVAK